MLDVPLLVPPTPGAGPRTAGSKLALGPVHVSGIRIRLEVALKATDLTLFDPAIRWQAVRLRPGSAEGF